MTDRFTPVGPAEETERRNAPAAQKLFWFVVIAIISVACVASVAYLMRALLSAPAADSASLLTHGSGGDSATIIAPARAADAPEELDGFAFLIGCFRLETSMRDVATGAWTRVGKGAWRGRWALDGWAINDEWTDIPFPGWAEDMGRGSNTRIYDTDGERFVIAWAHSEVQESRDRRARRSGNRIVVWQPSPDFDGFNWEARFEIGEDGSWTRTDVTSLPDAEDWTEIRKIDAFMAACDDQAW